MSKEGDEQQLDPLRQEALGWVERLTSGRATRADAAAFKNWLGQSPTHETAFAEASSLWKNIGPAGLNLRIQGVASAGLTAAHRRIDRRAILGGGPCRSDGCGRLRRHPASAWSVAVLGGTSGGLPD